MSRCKACNVILKGAAQTKMIITEEGLRIPEDLCNRCNGEAHNNYSFSTDHEYQFESLTSENSFYDNIKNNS